MLSIVLAFAFAAGLLARSIGYPPLLGYLVAGFVAHGLGIGDGAALTPISEAGILLLLFSIGLKLNLSALKPNYVCGAAFLHMSIAIPLTTAVIWVVGLLYAPLSFDQSATVWTLAFALSFSSTVFAVKMFDERGETNSFYASIAIGILVVQDVMAVIYLVLMSGHFPSPWALLLFGLPLLRRPVRALFQFVGHGELLLLSGMVFALGSGSLFESLQLKSGLGALVAGVLIASAQREKAKELYKHLSSLKNLLLIGFIVQIGYFGFPSVPMLFVAASLAILIVLRPVIYFSLLVLFGLRARTSALVGISLFNYSEFGLIVAAVAVEQGMLDTDWVTTLALAMALSFLIATPFNYHVHRLFRRFQSSLVRLQNDSVLPEEAIGSLGDAETVVLGMGRIGRGAYADLAESHDGKVAGIDENYALTQRLIEQGYQCVHGDASDRDFWERTGLVNRKLLLLSLSNHRENLEVVSLARELGFSNTLVVTARFPDEKAELESLGCKAFYLYEEVGRDLAQYSLSVLQDPG